MSSFAYWVRSRSCARARPSPWAGRRTLTLLTGLLLSANQLVAVPTMIDWAWGEELPEHPRAALHNVVARLRSKLGRELIDATPAGYRLVTDREHLDVLQFEHLVAAAAGSAREGKREEASGQLAEALSLWHEPPLGNIDSPALCRDHVGRLIELYLNAQEKHAELCLQLGLHASAARQLAGAVAAHPFREPLVGQLMRALLAGGRRADALAAYETLHAGLRADLGVDPCPELQRLHVKVLRSGADLPPRPDRPPPSGRPPAAPACDLPGVVGRLYGRTRELEELGRRLAADDHGGADNGLVAIVGPAGAGKTALALRAAVRALNRFPDGHVYLNLRGYGDGAPLDPATALGRLLGSLPAAPASIPADLPDRAALYRRLAGDRRMIVVLDNARDSRQVRPLLACAQAACHTIVTSRSQLRGLVVREGAHRIGLAGIRPAPREPCSPTCQRCPRTRRRAPSRNWRGCVRDCPWPCASSRNGWPGSARHRVTSSVRLAPQTRPSTCWRPGTARQT